MSAAKDARKLFHYTLSSLIELVPPDERPTAKPIANELFSQWQKRPERVCRVEVLPDEVERQRQELIRRTSEVENRAAEFDAGKQRIAVLEQQLQSEKLRRELDAKQNCWEVLIGFSMMETMRNIVGTFRDDFQCLAVFPSETDITVKFADGTLDLSLDIPTMELKAGGNDSDDQETFVTHHEYLCRAMLDLAVYCKTLFLLGVSPTIKRTESLHSTFLEVLKQVNVKEGMKMLQACPTGVL